TRLPNRSHPEPARCPLEAFAVGARPVPARGVRDRSPPGAPASHSRAEPALKPRPNRADYQAGPAPDYTVSRLPFRARPDTEERSAQDRASPLSRWRDADRARRDV